VRLFVRALASVSALLALAALFASGASAARRVTVSARVPGQVAANGMLLVRGRIWGIGSATVVVQRRVGRRWVRLVEGGLGKHGEFGLTWTVLSATGRLRLRVIANRGGRVLGRSRQFQVRITKASRSSQGVVVSPRTRVLDASTVTSAPAPGTAGTLRYSGGNDVTVGQIIAIGLSPATPDGFLGQVTSVGGRGSETVVQTQPTTLLQALPTASFDEVISSQHAALTRSATRALARAAAASTTCTGSTSTDFAPHMSFGTSIDLKGNWSVLHGLQSASLTAGAHASASLNPTVAGKGSCTLNPVTLTTFAGPSASFVIGPVPVVLTSRISVNLDAAVSADATLSTGISAAISATAGVGWTKSGGFYPIQTVNPGFTYTRPTISANASVSANLTPKIDVLLYGAAGPQLALTAGLNLAANVCKSPWWTLTAPLSLTASLNIPALNLSSPTLNLYQHTFPLADAGQPFPIPCTFGDVTFGSDLAGTPIGVDAGCGSNGPNGQSCTVVAGGYRPGNGYPTAAPVSGVITRITIKSTTADSFTVRLVRPGPGGLPTVTAVSTGPVLMTSGTGAPETFAVHLPVQAGDLLAADGSRTRAVECDGGVDYTYSPPLADGATGSPTATIQGCHTLANATISPG